ncbi:phosphoglycolate phosphatase [Roseateles toxinivorans]|uniref:phosphoglycolate phosphatase n=1 Tax=Roseateles toxinivorans TaxID=270368 RepID=UPI00105DFEF2|nr:phosphoglycolate phosphatase [Roseateles toxinivorans]
MAAPTDIQAPLALIIDLDGTLIDTQADFVVALNLMLDDLRLPHIDGAFVAQTVGKGSEHLVAQTLKQVDAGTNRFELAMQRYQRHYSEINGRHAEVYPGALEGLQRFAELGLPMACLTNKPTDFALPLLADKGLSRFFSHVFGGDAFPRKKPDPLPLIKTCQALGTAPAHTWMVGDSSNDAQAARAAGCPVVLVSYGYNHGRPIREVDADAFIDRLDELHWS